MCNKAKHNKRGLYVGVLCHDISDIIKRAIKYGRRSLVGCNPWGCEESDTTERLHFSLHALEKEMATYSSVLAWRFPGTAEPGGLPSLGSHRVGHDSSDLAAAAAKCLTISESKWRVYGAYCTHLSTFFRVDACQNKNIDDGVNLDAIIILYNLNMKGCRHWREIWVKKLF